MPPSGRRRRTDQGAVTLLAEGATPALDYTTATNATEAPLRRWPPPVQHRLPE